MIKFRSKPPRPTAAAQAARIPAGQRLYVIGDIHGRRDLLERVMDMARADAQRAPLGVHHTLVFLGDYVDRGPDSRGVLDMLSGSPPPGFGAIHLKGNHEQAMLDFLTDTHVGSDWLRFGGQATLTSYGIGRPPTMTHADFLELAQAELRRRLPPTHMAFLNTLRSSLRFGDYLFTHAGIRPGVPLDRQDDADLLWIREPFLGSDLDHGAVVVHGHSISDEPEVRPNRIGIDTGAYATGRLTCLVLEGTERRFLSTL